MGGFWANSRKVRSLSYSVRTCSAVGIEKFKGITGASRLCKRHLATLTLGAEKIGEGIVTEQA